MKLPPLTRDQVRRVDQIAIQQYGLPGVALMENAGRGAAAVIQRLAPAGRIVILCGSGNNGGDGYVIARHLELAGRVVHILSVVDLDRLTGDAKINADVARRAEIEISIVSGPEQLVEKLSGATCIVDSLLGTGARGPLRGSYADAISIANSAEASMRFAIDIPSGLDCDSGDPSDPTFRADHTITFVASKIGFEREIAKPFVGQVHPVGIGVPAKLLRELMGSTL